MPTVYNCKTKKDLKTHIGQPASSVLVETSLFGKEILPGKKLAVVGPSAYERKWFATVTIDAQGNIAKVA